MSVVRTILLAVVMSTARMLALWKALCSATSRRRFQTTLNPGGIKP
jgi:hypothetical protein